MRRRYSFTKTRYEEEAQINVTPLIDVVFVVLIMFIVIAPLVETDRIELASYAKTAEHKTKQIEQNCPIIIHVHADNSIKVNGTMVNLAQLKETFKEQKLRQGQKVPQLFQDAKSNFGVFQKVKNALEEAGFEEVDVVLSPN